MSGAIAPVSFNGIVPTARLLASLIGVPGGAAENIAHTGAHSCRFILQEAARRIDAHALRHVFGVKNRFQSILIT